MKYSLFFLCFFLYFAGIAQEDMSVLYKDSPSIEGTEAYLPSPYVTAGNRIYMVGHQDGSFPDLGWHIPGEMGGIWNHPIKLMDGFDATIKTGQEVFALDEASQFINFPTANKHIFEVTEDLEVERWQFVPDDTEGIVVQYILQNNSAEEIDLDFSFLGHFDLRPTWLGEETNMINAVDTIWYQKEQHLVMAKDVKNPWFALYGSDSNSEGNNAKPSDSSKPGELTYSIQLPAGEKKILSFFITGSYNSAEAAIETFDSLKQNYPALIKEKQQRYQKLEERSRLRIPDERLQQTFEWLKYNSDWLVRTVPEIGSGIGAGLPDYPWWFGVDSEYALQGYMAVGQVEPVYNTIQLLDSVSNAVNGNGRIIHEMSTNGYVFNKGNINETPQFATLIWEIYKWNGDREFLQKYYPTIEKGLDWLLTEKDENKNLFPDGFGMMEIHGLDSEMIDVAAYTQKAFADASKMAAELDKTSASKHYDSIAAVLKERIRTQFWSEDHNSFADFIGTDEQALRLIEDAIVRADTLNKPWAVKELKQTRKFIQDNPSAEAKPFVLHHNWVVNTPMEMKIADTIQARKALATAEKFVNPFGVFVTGIDRDSLAGTDEGSFKGSKAFSYTGAVMTLPTGVQAIAENNYGNPDKALDYLQRMTRSFSYALPGSMYEVSPDYGMVVQAWNIYSFAVPIIRQFFGVDPMASEKKVTITPLMPSSWDEASLENVLIAENEFDIFYTKKDGRLSIEIIQKDPTWTLVLELSETTFPGLNILKSTVPSEEIENAKRFTSKGKSLVIEASYPE
jgi:glycogen debranching enzyme